VNNLSCELKSIHNHPILDGKLLRPARSRLQTIQKVKVGKHYQKGDCENYLFQDYQWKSGIGV
jgi:hypothetical protein